MGVHAQISRKRGMTRAGTELAGADELRAPSMSVEHWRFRTWWAGCMGGVVTAKKQIFVMMRNRKWAVVRQGTGDSESVQDRKQDAVERARKLAVAEGAEVVVSDLGGAPHQRSDYGQRGHS